AGPGVLTKAGGQGSSSQTWNGVTDGFSRVGNETNTLSHRLAYGRFNGQATVTAMLDGVPTPVEVADTGDHNWPKQWRSSLELTTGPHQLTVAAAHPSGAFTTNSSVWFTNNAS